jgi:uncharacterized membrane protein
MKHTLTTTTLATAIGLALAGTVVPAYAADMSPPAMNKERAMKYHLEKCYGVAARGKNDCAAGAHSCAGQATRDRDPASFILVPAGDCGKIAGGEMKGA